MIDLVWPNFTHNILAYETNSFQENNFWKSLLSNCSKNNCDIMYEIQQYL